MHLASGWQSAGLPTDIQNNLYCFLNISDYSLGEYNHEHIAGYTTTRLILYY